MQLLAVVSANAMPGDLAWCRWGGLEVLGAMTALQHLNLSGCNFELPKDPAAFRHLTALEMPLSSAWIW